MLDFITERESSWEFLSKTDLPIFIYGMGDGAEKILRVFDIYGIPTAGFFASDEFVRGHSFKGHFVHKLSQIEEAVEEFVIVLAFGAGYESLYTKITDMSKRHILLAPDVPVVGGGLFTYEYCAENADKIEKVYSLLADDLSRQTFADVINFRISGKIDYLDRCTVDRSHIFDKVITFTDGGDYIDMGAYNGDTVLEHAELTDNRYGHIYALEPDPRNFRKLTDNTAQLERITCCNAAAWSEDGELYFDAKSGRNSLVTADSEGGKKTACIAGDSLTDRAAFIKMDVEGAESQALDGCRRSLENGASLICALYHRTEDLFELPLKVHEINPDLKLYIRHLMYIPAWETNLYCVGKTDSYPHRLFAEL